MKTFNPDKKYIIHKLTGIGMTLLVAFLIFYLLYHVSIGLRTHARSTPAVYGEAYETVAFDGYIFRDEEVIHSLYNGVTLYEAEENEKIGASSSVASVYRAGASLSVIAEIESLEHRIEILSEAAGRAHLLTDSSVIDSLIDASLYEYAGYAQSGDIGNAIKSSDDLLINLSRKQLRVNSATNYDSLITLLQTEKDRLLLSLGTPEARVSAGVAGYFSRKCDGYEDIFDYGQVMALTYTDLKEMIEVASVATHPNNTVGKVIKSTEWYIVCPTTHAATDSFTAGATYELTFSDNMNTSLPAKLVRIATENQTDKALLIFECTRTPPDFDYIREQSIEISVSRVSGLKIPRSAVRYEDGYTYVYILYGEKVYRREIEIIGAAGESYYVKDDTEKREINGVTYYGIRHNDSVIIYGTNLQHEKIYN